MPSAPYLVIRALLDETLSGLDLAPQNIIVPFLLVDLLPVRVHLRHQLRIALLQANPRRVGALHLRLDLRHFIQQADVLAGNSPVVERKYGDDHHQGNEEERREAASPSVCTKPNHFREKSTFYKLVIATLASTTQISSSPCYPNLSKGHADEMLQTCGRPQTVRDIGLASSATVLLVVLLAVLLPYTCHPPSLHTMSTCISTTAGTWHHATWRGRENTDLAKPDNSNASEISPGTYRNTPSTMIYTTRAASRLS